MIPIFIITCDRLEMLKKSMQSYYDYIKTPFEIVICDQGSTFKPTIEFLEKLEFDGTIVYRWKENFNIGRERNLRRDDVGLSENIQNYFKNHPKSNYVTTDPDIFLDNVGSDILEVYAYFLKKIPQINAVGPMLRIDDIPDYYPRKKEVINWETKFHGKVNTIQYENREIKYVFAPIHTSFAMYRKETQWGGYSKNAIRVLAPYLAKHLNWYIDPKNMTEDQEYYKRHASKNTHWSKWT